MGTVKSLSDVALRDFETSNVPASGVHNPEKQDLRSIFDAIDAFTIGAQVGGAVVFTTVAAASISLAYPANQMAWVILDPNPNSNGVYQKQGASGSGSWARVASLPYSFYRATNSGAGSANAILASNSSPSAAANGLVIFNVTAENTSSVVTVPLNGGAALRIKSAAGNDPAVGALKPNMLLAGFIEGSSFRLISDLDSAAAQAAAEAASAAAVAAKDAAEAARDEAVMIAVDGKLPATQVLATESGDNAPVALVQIIKEYPPSVERFRSKAGGSARSDIETLNAASAAYRNVMLEPRQYDITQTWALQSECCVWAAVPVRSVINRVGVWNGNTITIGQNLAGQGAYAFELSGIKFQQDHTGFVPGTSTSLPNRLTNGQKHLEVWGGTYARIDKCSFDGTAIGLHLLGSAYTTIRDCTFTGVWDNALTGNQECFASTRLSHDPVHGLLTVPTFDNCVFSGGPTPVRTITNGDITFSSHEDGGPAYHFYIDGAEGLIVKNKYMGAANSALVYVQPNGVCTNLDFGGGFVDGARLSQFWFRNGGAGLFSTMVNIHDMFLNGQQLTPNGILVDYNDGLISAAGFTVSNVTAQAHNKATMQLFGVSGGKVIGSTIGSYNSRHGRDTDPEYAAGIYVGGVSTDVHLRSCDMGGNINSFSGTANGCRWGAFFTGSGTIASSSAADIRGGANLGVSGGSIVGGLTQTIG